MYVPLNRQGDVPLYIQIRDHFRHLIVNGSLRPGAALPPERKLALNLGVNRTTVATAYRELAAEGMVSPHVGRGTLVRQQPESENGQGLIEGLISWWDLFAPTAHQLHNPELMDALEPVAPPDSFAWFSGADPASDLCPLHEISACLAKVLRLYGEAAFRPSPPEGCEELRRVVAERLSRAGCAIGPERVVIVAGRDQGSFRLAQILLRPGDIVAVEVPSRLRPTLDFRTAGAQLVGVPLDDHGMKVYLLERVLSRCRPKFLFTMPTFQAPSGVTMTVERRHDLLTVAHEHRLAVIELDSYSELWYDDPPPPPLVSLEKGNTVVHVGSWGRFLLPGLQIGWVVGPNEVTEQITAQNSVGDLRASTLCQLALAEFVRQGLFDQHLVRLRQEFARRRDAIVKAINEHWPTGTHYVKPQGGKYLWLRLPGGLKADALLVAAVKVGVSYEPGQVFHVDSGGKDWIRLNFTQETEARVYEGMERLGAVARSVLSQQ